MLKKKQGINQFNSGGLFLCSIENRSVTKTLLFLRYKKEKIGVTRFYQARVSDSKIDMLISVPINPILVDTDRSKYVVELDGEFFDLDNIQRDEENHKVQLTLKRGGIKYKDDRTTS